MMPGQPDLMAMNKEASADAICEEKSSPTQVLRDSEEISLLAAQSSVSARRDEHGNLLLVQENWPDEDSIILVHRDYEQAFLDSLCDFLGIAPVGNS